MGQGLGLGLGPGLDNYNCNVILQTNFNPVTAFTFTLASFVLMSQVKIRSKTDSLGINGLVLSRFIFSSNSTAS